MVEEGEAFVPASEDEVMEVEHLLAQAKYENALDNDLNHLNSADTEKYLMLENFPCSDEFYGTDTDFGISNTEATQSDGQCLDNILKDHDKDRSLHVIQSPPNDGSDYISEIEFIEKSSHLHCDQHSGYSLGNLSLGYPQILEVDSDADETLDLANTANTSDQNAMYFGNISIREVHDTFRGTCGQGAALVDKQHVLFGLNSLMDLDDTSINLRSRLLSDENEDVIFLSTNDLSEISCGSLTSALDHKTSEGKSLNKRYSDKDTVTANILGAGRFRLLEMESRDHALVTRKRMRKPTRRYIEESSEVKSRQCTEKVGSPGISSQNKILDIRAHDTHWKRSESTQLSCSEDSSTLSNNQMSCILQRRRGRPRKNLTCVDLKGKKGYMQKAVEHKTIYGSILSQSVDEDGILDSPRTQSDKCGARRKHHRLWTLTEVTKLIEGVSRYGVGRWTDIKRLLFSSSAYRTSVDLKDKWRNLLRASGAHMHGRKEFETRKKHLPMVPQSVLRRVRDLAAIHPYPRKRKTGVPLLAPIPADDGKDTSCNTKRTVVQRRSST